MESAAAEEINKGCLRRHLRDDFHKLLGSLLASTLPTSPTATLLTINLGVGQFCSIKVGQIYFVKKSFSVISLGPFL